MVILNFACVMAYTKSFYHIVFRTKHSVPSIAEAHERDLFMYVFAYCQRVRVKLWRINSMPDHMHLLVSLPPDVSVAAFVRDVKQVMGNYMKPRVQEFPHWGGWATGYCSLTYSERDRDTIIRYIQNQKEHHRNVTLVDEVKSLLSAEGVAIDERYFPLDWRD